MRNAGLLLAVACALAWHSWPTDARPTIYMLNDNDKLEPALVPVSSTVIPMPVYKVGVGLEISGKKVVKPIDPSKLITGNKKKVSDDYTAINVKQISKEEFEAA